MISFYSKRFNITILRPLHRTLGRYRTRKCTITWIIAGYSVSKHGKVCVKASEHVCACADVCCVLNSNFVSMHVSIDITKGRDMIKCKER